MIAFSLRLLAVVAFEAGAGVGVPVGVGSLDCEGRFSD